MKPSCELRTEPKTTSRCEASRCEREVKVETELRDLWADALRWSAGVCGWAGVGGEGRKLKELKRFGWLDTHEENFLSLRSTQRCSFRCALLVRVGSNPTRVFFDLQKNQDRWMDGWMDGVVRMLGNSDGCPIEEREHQSSFCYSQRLQSHWPNRPNAPEDPPNSMGLFFSPSRITGLVTLQALEGRLVAAPVPRSSSILVRRPSSGWTMGSILGPVRARPNVGGEWEHVNRGPARPARPGGAPLSIRASHL